MKTIYIYHHLGFGDHIICNGLVRHYAALYDKVYVFCKPHNVKNVSYMYRDNENIELFSANDNETISFMDRNKQNNYLIIGHEKLWEKLIDDLTFDFIFYDMAGISIENKIYPIYSQLIFLLYHKI